MIKKLVLTAMFAGLMSAAFVGTAKAAAGDTIPHETGLVAVDADGNSWNIDNILDSNKVLVVLNTFAG